MNQPYNLILGDCLEVIPTVPSGSVDLIFTDPPYPYIKREYGYWTEETWIPMMQEVVKQGRRILKPHGSMVMVLQPNSEKVGKMRPWLWKFMVWCCEEWGIVQDAYWWNYTAMPGKLNGLMRSSIKSCLWLGEPNCYRNQDAILWTESHHTTYRRKLRHANRSLYDKRIHFPSGHSVNTFTLLDASEKKGGTTPFNIILCESDGNRKKKGKELHGATTPLELTDWWLRYLTKPGDTVLDPFNGSGTTGVAALKLNRRYIGVERMEKYIEASKVRLGEIENVQLGMVL